MEKTTKKKQSKTRRILGTLLLTGILAVGYGSCLNNYDDKLIKALSQKKEFTVGIDFEAYNSKERLGIELKEEALESEANIDLKNKEIINWGNFIEIRRIIKWHSLTYANALSFTPYYGNLETSYVFMDEIGKEKGALKRIDEGDANLEDLLSKIKEPNFVILKIKGDKRYYEKLQKHNVLDFITERIAQSAMGYNKNVVIELEAPDDGDYEAHKRRIDLIKKTNPEFKIATSLDEKECYNTDLGTWDPEKSRKYWENSDIIIFEDYFSDPSSLEKSIKNFRDATKDTKNQIWIRVVIGTKRINKRNITDHDLALKEYEEILGVVNKYADGCLINDSNGIWLFSDKAYDAQERLKRTKKMFKAFRNLKIERKYSYGGGY